MPVSAPRGSIARAKEGRDPQPSAAIVDTQSIKTSTNAPLETQGADAAKKITGRKRAIVTDVCGFLPAVVVLAAPVSENYADMRAIDQAKANYPTITKAWVDQGFKNQFVEHAATFGIDAEVVARDPGKRGFHVPKRRWVVERSIGRLMLHRRLARDHEARPTSSEAEIHLAMIDNVSKRITDESTPTWRGTY